MQRADVHLLSPSPAISPCSLYILDIHPPPPNSPWLTSKRTPNPLKVPFSLVLMADRLWPHSLSAAACPHCVPLSAQQRVGGGQTASPNSMPDMDVWVVGGGAFAPRAELSSTCHMHPRWEGERDTDQGYLWHSDACLTLEEANHRIEVLRMMGYRLSGGGSTLNANPFLIKIGSV